MRIYSITPQLKLIELEIPVPGYGRFLGAYLFCGVKRALVETGPRAAVPSLLAALDSLGISPAGIDYIILTHIHIDHAGGIGTAIRHMSNARVVAHPRARNHLIDPTRLWQASRQTLGDLVLQYGEIEPVPADRVISAADKMPLDLGQGLVLEIYFTPGHAPHQLSVFDRASGVLLAGEAAGVCVNGTLRLATPPPFRLEETLASLDRLIALAPRKVCYGHFGCYDDAAGRLTFARRKLLEWHEFVRSVAGSGKSPEDVLALLREQDRNLDYLNQLTPSEYDREYALILNSVRGLLESVQESAGK